MHFDIRTLRALLHYQPERRLRSALFRALNTSGVSADELAQTAEVREWIVEDFVSPGLELLVSTIGRLSNMEVAIEASYQLACLLHDNWSSFERYDWLV
ncbi:unnamed protein product [Echinostoma caproni]|uniref:Transcriptional regulator n=1 Tax=Echinostoma caproni TaxID=27848 RepID=A0A183A4K9_9TREM|nr:unnamed protein product [Echinostoma caproni]